MGNVSFQNNVPDPLLSGKVQTKTFSFHQINDAQE
jgi:hypothetical protein